MRYTFQQLFEEIKVRKVGKALVFYIGLAIPVIGVASMLESRYALDSAWFDRLLLLLAVILVLTLVAAWRHGKRKSVKVTGLELAFYVLTLLAAVGLGALFPEGSPSRRPVRTPADMSIAVLPFLNFSDNKDDEFFSDGITEDILTQLSKIAELRVISRTTMMQYKGTKKSLREIGQELMVGTILEGSVRREGDRVRVVGQLIDARSDEHLWAETYDREIRDIFAIQTEVAQQIARQLRAVLSPEEKQRIAAPPTANTEAYALYLRGRHHYSKYREESNEIAITFFAQATTLDTSYALAYAGLSDAYSQRVQRYGYTIDWIDSAIAAAKRAISLAPEAAEGYKALGLAYDNQGLTAAALEQYEQAVRLNPNFALAHRNIGLLNYRTGKLDRALEAGLKVVSLVPDDAMGYVQVGMTLQALELDSAARAWYIKARRCDPENPFPLVGLGWLHLTRSELRQARAAVETLLTLSPSLPPAVELLVSLEIAQGRYSEAVTAYERSRAGPNAMGAYAMGKLGKGTLARQTAWQSIQRCQRRIGWGDQGSTPLLEMAESYAVMGQSDSALAALERAIAAGWYDWRGAMVDPTFSILRSNQRFQSLLEGRKQHVAAMRSRVAGMPY